MWCHQVDLIIPLFNSDSLSKGREKEVVFWSSAILTHKIKGFNGIQTWRSYRGKLSEMSSSSLEQCVAGRESPSKWWLWVIKALRQGVSLKDSHLDPHPSVPFCRIWILDHHSVCPIILLQLLVYSSSAQTLSLLGSDLTLYIDGTLVLCLAHLVPGHTTNTSFLLLNFPTYVMMTQIIPPYSGTRSDSLG